MIKIIYEPERKRSAVYDENKEIGEITFSESEECWTIDHTSVDKDYGGKGIAGKLVADLVDQARKNNKKIKPLCPFAKKEFDEKPQYSDVLLKQS